MKQYLKKLTSSKSGSSDITLQNKITGEYIFISCKFCYDDSNNNIKYYEVQDIHSAILKNNYKYKKYKIYLFVNNKEKVEFGNLSSSLKLNSTKIVRRFEKRSLHLLLHL